MTPENILRFIHSWNRWLILLVAVVAIIYFVWGLVTKQTWTKSSKMMLTIFGSLVGLQWLLGIIFLIRLGSLTGFGVGHYWEHLTAQTVALLTAHWYVRWHKQDLDDAVKYRRGVILVVATLVLIVLGIMVLPSATQWRFMSL